MAYTYGYVHNINESMLLNNNNKNIKQVRNKHRTISHTINHDD